MDDREPTYDELKRRVAELEAQVSSLTRQVEQLLKLLDEKNRSGKRQAAPFSKGPPKQKPKKPGRKSGDDYGTHQRRDVPKQIDETIHVTLPKTCPHCEGESITETSVQQQYQVEIPRTVIQRQFNIHIGCCDGCGKRIQPRHELQTSNALGAAASQLGPNLQAAMAILNKELGLTHGKIERLLSVLFELNIARSTSVRSMLRTAKKASPAFEEIQAEVRQSPVIKVDETGWKHAGYLKWLHVMVSKNAVLYQIGGRGREVLESLIGRHFRGTLIHDGYASYDGFWLADHQQCVAHLLKRCRELLETATRGAVRFPRAVKELLQRGLSIRDRFQTGELTLPGIRALGTKLTTQLSALVERVKSHAGNERFAKFLEKHLREVFWFLQHPATVSATNNESEFELRFNVIARKLSGGSRSEAGLTAQQTLPSIIRTCRKLNHDPFDYLENTLRSPNPTPLFNTR